MDPSIVLAQVRGRLRRVVALGGAARLVAVVIAGAGAAVLADRLWFLPGWLRLALLLAILGGATLLTLRRLVRPLRHRLPDRELAAFVEGRLPALDGRLLTAVDGIALDARDGEQLAAALGADPAARLVPAQALPRLLLDAGVVVAAALTVALLMPPFWRDGLTRLLLPLAEHDWERTTAFTARLERAVIAVDEPATVVVERTAGRPGAVRVGWDDGRGHGGVRQLPGSTGPWRQAIALSHGSWILTISGGDAHPLRLPVQVVERPRLDGASARLIPPAYSGLPIQDLPSPACQALPGSRLELSLRLALPKGRRLQAVSATCGGAPLVLDGVGTTRTGSTTITTTSELLISASDADGIALRPAARFPITVEPDRAPSVSLAGPRSDETVGPRAKVAITVEAADDLGLASLSLTATALAPGAAAGASPSDPRLLHQETLDGRRSIGRKLLVEVAGLAGPGGTISLVGGAADRNDVTGPGLGTSAVLVLRVVAEDELRRDLERQLSEARDRISQARSQLAPGLADAGKLPTGSRAAAQDAARAAELLARAERRWQENALEAERIAPAAVARAAAGAAAAPLALAGGGDQEAARAADAQLDQAERALDRMLSDSDLTRIVAQLLERQKALHAESRAFIRAHLIRQPDEAGRTRQTDLAARQADLAKRCADAERKILSAPAALDPAKAVVRASAPGELMVGAAADVASTDQRPRALERQTRAITALEDLLTALRGGDQQSDLARRVGELADRQERLAEAIERGQDAAEAQREQDRLRDETARVAAEVKQPDDAERALDAAVGAQDAAGKSLGANDRSAAGRDAGTAADLLRRAQKALDPHQENKPPESEKHQTDILALLRTLYDQQTRVLADSQPIFTRLGDDELDFAGTRDVTSVAQLQDDILLRLREDGIKALDRHPIAASALKRVEATMQRVLDHLRTPALGSRGLALERIALHELQRLIDIAGNLPQYRKEGGDQQGGGQSGNQAPFPPAAEIALLWAEQDDIQAAAAAGRPAPLAERQSELVKLLMLVESAIRPGTRPAVLMTRARRAAADAGLRLNRSDRGTTTREQMVVASESLRQLLAEAKGDGGGGGGSAKSKPQPKDGQGKDDGRPPPARQGDPTPARPSDAAAAAAAAAAAQQRAGEAGTGVSTDQARTLLLQLPAERREQLRQAREERLPAGALQLYERYLEKLEEP